MQLFARTRRMSRVALRFRLWQLIGMKYS